MTSARFPVHLCVRAATAVVQWSAPGRVYVCIRYHQVCVSGVWQVRHRAVFAVVNIACLLCEIKYITTRTQLKSNGNYGTYIAAVCRSIVSWKGPSSRSRGGGYLSARLPLAAGRCYSSRVQYTDINTYRQIKYCVANSETMVAYCCIAFSYLSDSKYIPGTC